MTMVHREHVPLGENRLSPVTRMYLPPVLSVRLPGKGTTAIITSEEGAKVRPAFSAEKPSADRR